MKFPLNVRILKGPPDYSAFACVFFLLLMFVMLGPVTYTSGIRVQLPVSGELPGPAGPSVSAAVDLEGRLYFQNEQVTEVELGLRLARSFTGRFVFCAASAAMQQKIADCDSLPPKPPPIRRISTVTWFATSFSACATTCCISVGCCVEQ